MSEFIYSNDVKMFPSANRDPAYDSTSRLTTEFNLVNIVNRLLTTDNNGFVITTTQNNTVTSNDNIEFCIKGYYFNVKLTNLLSKFNDKSVIYAYIKLVALGDNAEFTELEAIDGSIPSSYKLDSIPNPNDNNKTDFLGLAFDYSEPDSQSYASLLILQKDENNWVIPKESQVRYIIKSPMGTIATLKIDDGVLQ